MSYSLEAMISPVLAAVLAPLLLGVIHRVKAFFAGRKGQPLLQAYFDLSRLLKKGAVYSRTTTWVFRAGPMVGLAAVASTTLLVPLGGLGAPVSFSLDLVLFAYLLGLARFFTVLAALDTGSAFEGMGASREVQIAVFAEPAVLLGLATLARVSGSLSLDGMYAGLEVHRWPTSGPALVLVALAFFVVLLAENSRIPFDDPNTHLELTMVHEVMVLDHSGPDLAFILYGASLKLWVMGALFLGVVLPYRGGPIAREIGVFVLGMLFVAVLIGVVESVTARIRLLRIPHVLMGACAFAALALVLVLR